MPIPTFSGPPTRIDELTGRQPTTGVPGDVRTQAQLAAGTVRTTRVRGVRGRRAGNLAPVPVPAAPAWTPQAAVQAQRNLGTAASNAYGGTYASTAPSYGRGMARGTGEFSPVFRTVLGSDPNDPNYRRP